MDLLVEPYHWVRPCDPVYPLCPRNSGRCYPLQKIPKAPKIDGQPHDSSPGRAQATQLVTGRQ